MVDFVSLKAVQPDSFDSFGFAGTKKRTRLDRVRLLKSEDAAGRLGAGVFFDIFDHVAHALELFGFFIGHFNGEFFFKGHHELDRIEGVGSKVFDEAGTKDDLLSVDSELIDDDVTHFFFDGFF